MRDINKLFDGKSVEDIISNLKSNNSEWSKKTLETLAKMSPTSLKTSFKLLEMGANLELQECLQIEYRISQQCCENHDFIEGMPIDFSSSTWMRPSLITYSLYFAYCFYK